MKKIIVFIHGAGGGRWEWEYWRNYFRNQGFDCYCPTLTGDKDAIEEVTFDDYLLQIKKLIKQIGAKPIIIGASMGGIIAQKLAESKLAKAIVLINSVPPKGVTKKNKRKIKKYPPIIKWSTQSKLQDTINSMPEASRKTILWAHKRWRDESGKVLNEILKGIDINKKQITCPILVMAGKNDEDITPEESLEIAHYYNADYFAFEDVSHVGALLGKHFKKIAAVTGEWIESVLS